MLFRNVPTRLHGVLSLLVLLFACAACGQMSRFSESDDDGRPRKSDRAVALPGFEEIEDVEERKKSFFDFLRPIVESENAIVLRQRSRMLRLYGKHRKKLLLSWTEIKWLEELVDEYGINGTVRNSNSAWENLRRRIDKVPEDLALIQAAKESGWGTSRFAREGNNLFGQRCFAEGCGIVPMDREPGANHEVAIFTSAVDSVRSYLHNLNTNSAYKDFRQLRFDQRREGKIPDGYSLVKGLPKYSERREAYLSEIRDMILMNRLFLDS